MKHPALSLEDAINVAFYEAAKEKVFSEAMEDIRQKQKGRR